LKGKLPNNIKRISHLSLNCKSWIEKDFRSIHKEIPECHFCSSIHSFKYTSVNNVWRWDITIPGDWQYGEWDQIKLLPKQVPLPIMRCCVCDKLVKVIPAFFVKGTTLALSALIFLAFVYENTLLAWRSLPEKFCKEGHKIAHSTIYRAVHGLGKNLLEDEEVRELYTQWAISFRLLPQTAETVWPSEKSQHPHTRRREDTVRNLLVLFLCLIRRYTEFTDLFLRFMELIHLLFSRMKKHVERLYTRHKRKDADTS